MIVFHKIHGLKEIAELKDDEFIISQTQEALDLMAQIGLNCCNRIIIYEENLHPNFFDLKTRIAGDILQKFSIYRIKLAIIGDFSKYKSKSMQAFIRESNKGNIVYF